jgi:hypothetical protein
MMVKIWMEHKASDGTEHNDDHADIQIMHDQYQLSMATWADYDDCDYDPWAPINVPTKQNANSAVDIKPNGAQEDPTTSNHQNIDAPQQTPHAEVPLNVRFPKYPWKIDPASHDNTLQIKCHDGIDTKQLHKVKFTSVVTHEGVAKNKQADVPGSLWHPLAQWISTQRWTDIALERGIRNSKLHQNATWMELALAFQLQSGHSILSSKTDLDNQTRCFRVAFARLLQHKGSSIKINNKKANYRTTFRPTRCVQTAAAITGKPDDGIHRRPLMSDDDTAFIAKVIQEHHERACAISAEAEVKWRNDYTVRYPARRPQWVPHPIAQLYEQLHHRQDQQKAEALRRKSHNTNTVASKTVTPHINVVNSEKDTCVLAPVHPIVNKSATQQPLKEKRKRDDQCGPCFFGHTTTSLRYRGEVNWSRNPEPTFWEKVPVGATLCYKCYNLGWRQKKQGGGGRPPDNNNANKPIEMHTEEHEEIRTEIVLSIDAQTIDRSSEIDDNGQDEHNHNHEAQELQSSSKYRRCANRLRNGIIRRDAKATSIHGVHDDTLFDARSTYCKGNDGHANSTTNVTQLSTKKYLFIPSIGIPSVPSAVASTPPAFAAPPTASSKVGSTNPIRST